MTDIKEMERRKRIYQIYRTDCNNKEYKISVQDFRDWLRKDNKEETFIKDLREAKNDIVSIYDVAVDYSISVELIKFFMREYL